MSVEQLLMPFMAFMLVIFAVMGTATAGSVSLPVQPRQKAVAAEKAMLIDCEVVEVNVSDSEIVVKVDEAQKTYQISTSAEITKDGKDVKLAALAEGDYATLHLASSGSSLVTRIQAVSSQ